MFKKFIVACSLPIVLLFGPMIAQCVPAYAQLRAEPRHSAELVSQLICGELVRVLKEDGPWVLIRTEHGYEGFTRTEQIQFHSDPINYSTLHRLQKTEIRKENTPFQKLEPEGSIFLNYILKTEAKSDTDIFDITFPPLFSSQTLANQAMRLLTVPYVWGGKTVFGLDCSGLVQFLFQKQGYSFPRDAWQQAEIGLDISFDSSKPEFEPGDLLFFQNPGKKVHHVAISLGGSRYIHASEWVRINSLHEADADFKKERKETLVNAKRIQPETLVSLLDSFRKL